MKKFVTIGTSRCGQSAVEWRTDHTRSRGIVHVSTVNILLLSALAAGIAYGWFGVPLVAHDEDLGQKIGIFIIA